MTIELPHYLRAGTKLLAVLEEQAPGFTKTVEDWEYMTEGDQHRTIGEALWHLEGKGYAWAQRPVNRTQQDGWDEAQRFHEYCYAADCYEKGINRDDLHPRFHEYYDQAANDAGLRKLWERGADFIK